MFKIADEMNPRQTGYLLATAVLLLLGQAKWVKSEALSPHGFKVCSHITSKPVANSTSYPKAKAQRYTTWCVIGWRCTRYRTVYKTQWKTVYLTQYVTSYTCCTGWRQSGNECRTPICRSPCQNGGHCLAPDTCSCPSGWTGATCNQGLQGVPRMVSTAARVTKSLPGVSRMVSTSTVTKGEEGPSDNSPSLSSDSSKSKGWRKLIPFLAGLIGIIADVVAVVTTMYTCYSCYRKRRSQNLGTPSLGTRDSNNAGPPALPSPQTSSVYGTATSHNDLHTASDQPSAGTGTEDMTALLIRNANYPDNTPSVDINPKLTVRNC